MYVVVLLIFSFSSLYSDVICRDLGLQFDALRLQEETHLVADEYVPRHGDYWSAIPLRNATGTHLREGVNLIHTIKDHKMLPCTDSLYLEELPYIASILDHIRAQFDTQIGLVRLSKVPSGKAIPRHHDGSDFDIDKGSICRLHIPIITGENVVFEIAGNSYNLEAGKLYYTNVAKFHSVTNDGPFDRVHIVIDVHMSKPLYEYIMHSSEVESK